MIDPALYSVVNTLCTWP